MPARVRRTNRPCYYHQQMRNRLLRVWRRFVIVFARRMPIESPALCMAFSVLFLLTAVYVLPEMTQHAGRSPLLAEAINGNEGGWLYLRWLDAFLTAGAGLAAWIFQARCLQLCFPDYYDPYAVD